MPKHLKPRGRHFELPIIGHRLAELRLGMDRPVMLLFRDQSSAESKLEIEDSEALPHALGRIVEWLHPC